MFDIRNYIVNETTKYRSRLNRLTKDPESFFESGFNKTDYSNFLNYFTVKAAQESIGLNKSFTPNLSAMDDLIDNRDEYIEKYGKTGYNSLYSAKLSQAKGDIENINKAMKWKGTKLTAGVLNSSAWLKDRYVYDPENPEDMMAQSLGYAPAALDQKTAKAIIAEAKKILKAKTKNDNNAAQDHYALGFSLAPLDEIAPGNRPATEAEIKDAMNVINEAYGLNSYLTPEQQQEKRHGLVPLPGTGKPGIRVTLPNREPKDKGRFSVQEPMRIQLTSGQPGLNDNGRDEKGQDDKRDPLTEDHVYITEDEYNTYLDVLKDEYNTYYSETDEYGNPIPKATPEDINKRKVKLEENWEWSIKQDNEKKEEPVTLYYPGTDSFDDYINREDYDNAEDYYNAIGERCSDYINNGDEEGFKKFLNENKIDPFTMSYVGEYIEKQRKQNDKAQIVAGNKVGQYEELNPYSDPSERGYAGYQIGIQEGPTHEENMAIINHAIEQPELYDNFVIPLIPLIEKDSSPEMAAKIASDLRDIKSDKIIMYNRAKEVTSFPLDNQGSEIYYIAYGQKPKENDFDDTVERLGLSATEINDVAKFTGSDRAFVKMYNQLVQQQIDVDNKVASYLDINEEYSPEKYKFLTGNMNYTTALGGTYGLPQVNKRQRHQ